VARVSVVIPVYNIAPHLRQCLDSVITQTLEDIEIICVDDGSTDESPAILSQYTEEDSRIQVVTQKNAGPGAARNAGISRATGEYLIFLDSDDWFEPDLLERMAEKAQQTQADVVVCRAVSFDSETGKELPSGWMLNTNALPKNVFAPKDIAADIFQFTHGWPWDKLYRRDYIQAEGFRFPDLRNSQDLVFVFASILCAKKIAVIEQCFIHHRFNRKASVSNTRHEYLTAPYEAVQLLKAEMEKRGISGIYEDSFLNWIVGFLPWHVGSIKCAEKQKECLARLRDEWFPSLGVYKHPLSYYRKKQDKIKLFMVRYVPHRMFWIAFSGYNRLKTTLKR